MAMGSVAKEASITAPDDRTVSWLLWDDVGHLYVHQLFGNGSHDSRGFDDSKNTKLPDSTPRGHPS